MRGQTALVATPGGHIDELHEVAGRWGVENRFWITAATPQTSSMLAGEDVEWVRAVGARQAWQAGVSLAGALRIMRRRQPGQVVSTGAALAVPYLLAARALRIPVTYIESATRFDGPSITGQIMERTPGARLLSQAPWPDRPRWGDFGSIFDSFASRSAQVQPVRSAVVTVGSERFPFSRAIDLARAGLPTARIRWQTGHTEVDPDLPGEHRRWWPAAELAAAVQEADLLITHAGVGSILTALRLGTCPVVLVRRAEDGEHIDDHQVQLAAALEARDLIAVAHSHDDFADAVERAMSRRIVRT
ncbi:MAG: glycosyltransferase [Actinomycetia bacterium]|nr:glycosyltransferase [Actinomycetes bacterium]